MMSSTAASSNNKRPAQSGSQVPKIKACHQCKKDHKKCEALRPCSRCVSLGISDCRDAPMKKLGRPKKRRLGETADYDSSYANQAFASFIQPSVTYTLPNNPDELTQIPQRLPPATTGPSRSSVVEPSTAMLATILEEVKSLAAVTSNLQKEQAVLRNSLAAICPALPAPQQQQKYHPHHQLVLSSSPSSSDLSSSDEDQDIEELIETAIMHDSLLDPSRIRRPGMGKRFFCTWQEIQQNGPFTVPNSNTTHNRFYPFVAPQHSPLLSAKDIRISSLISNQSNNPLFELYERSNDMPFILTDGSKPFVVLRMYSRTPDPTPEPYFGCPFARVVFTRVAVSSTFCQILNHTEEELMSDPSIEIFYITPDRCEFVAAVPYLFQKSHQPASPILYFNPSYITKEGKILPSTTKCQIFYNPSGDASFLILSIEELTDNDRITIADGDSTQPAIEFAETTNQSTELNGVEECTGGDIVGGLDVYEFGGCCGVNNKYL